MKAKLGVDRLAGLRATSLSTRVSAAVPVSLTLADVAKCHLGHRLTSRGFAKSKICQENVANVFKVDGYSK